MKAATINEIKRELLSLDAKALSALCLRLAKYKTENKQLLTYLIYEAEDENAYVEAVKEEAAELFATLPKNIYFIKKSLRKILRFINKHIKYSGQERTELELRIFFCQKVREAKVPLQHHTVLFNMYKQQLEKIYTAYNKLEEDLQADYTADIESLTKK